MDKPSEFEHIFKAYYTQLFCFARQMINDEEECHDIVSEAYENMWRNRENIHMETARAYLYACVRNKCINNLRRSQIRRQYIEYYIKVTEPYANTEELAERMEKERIIREVIEEMQPLVRDIVKACLINGKKYSEVADDMGISLSLVKKHMVKAMTIIKESVLKKFKTGTFILTQL